MKTCPVVILADGLFGQCQESSLQDQPYFQVTEPVLQHLQNVLRHLMGQGLSWQDDRTQYVISREMERIPRLHLPSSWESLAEDRFPPIYQAPRRSSLPSEPASLPVARQPPVPPALLQRYLELLLASQPELGYKEVLLSSDPHHQFSFPDGSFRDNSNARNPEPPILLDRAAASKALLGASSAPSYRGQQGLDGGQLFQDLGALYLAQAQTGKSSTKPQQNSRTNDLLQDDGDSSESRKSWTPLTDRAVQKLAVVLASNGIRLQDLSPQQISSLTGLIKLLQSQSKHDENKTIPEKVTEAEMQHGEELEPPPLPSQGSSVSALPTEGQIQSQQETLGPTKAKAAMTTTAASPKQPHLLRSVEGDTTDSKGLVVLKKSYAALGVPGQEEERTKSVLAAEEYGYIVTDQKQLGLAAGIRLLEMLAEHVHLSTASFINISIVGPAVTFRIRQNHQNLSLDDVANKA
ncbi:hypothetical protein lerEdw1_001185, partial [Lerista edwardsae]